MTPLPTSSDTSRLSQRVASYSERVDAEHTRFNADWRRARRRFALCAVLGAVLVVGVGVWGFRIETNTTNAPIGRARSVKPQGSTVMVVIDPGHR